jgi:rubrerythrin
MDSMRQGVTDRGPAQRGLMRSLGQLYLRRLLRTARGRAFMLSFMAYAEEADERGVFDALLARVDDPELRQLVRVHRDDEIRHAAMLKERLAQLGESPQPIPAELRVIDRILRHTGRGDQAFVAERTEIMETYLVLQVIEERGVAQFPKIANAMRPFDPASAAVIDRITRDEERHVRYAMAISRRYAPADDVLTRTLSQFRRGEALAFVEHSRAFLAYTTQRQLADGSGAERFFWRTLARLRRPRLSRSARRP